MTFNIQDEVKLNTILDSANNSGEAGQVLSSTGSNTLLWINQGDVTIPGSNTEIVFNNSGVLGANNQFVFDKETSRLGIGTNTPTQSIDVVGTINVSANVHVSGALKANGEFGTDGQILSANSTGGVYWTNPAITSTSFVELTDTPSTFTGAASRFVKVNSGASALEFVADPGYLTDGDFTSAGFMKTDGSGNYSIDASTYLTSETSHADVLVDGDFTSAGFMKTDGSGNYSIDASTYLTSETSHADVLVDGDFTSQGIMLRGATAGSYSILIDNSANWNTAFGWGDHGVEGYLTSVSQDTAPQLGGNLDAQNNNITNLGTINTHTIPGGTGTLALTSDLTGGTVTASNGLTNRIAVFTSSSNIEGDANFTWDGSTLDTGASNAVKAQRFIARTSTYTSITDYALEDNGVIRAGTGLWLVGGATGITAGIQFGTRPSAANDSSGGWNADVTERMRIQNDGNVGIACTAPTVALDVVGNVKITSATEAKLIIEGDTDNDTGEEAALLQFKSDGGVVGHTIGIAQGTVNDLVIASGNGTASHVSTGISLKTKPTSTTTTQQRMNISSVGDIAFYDDTSSSADFFWDASTQRLGIGTTAPEQAIHIDAIASSAIRLGETGRNYAYLLRANVSDTVNGGFLIEDAENGNDLYRVNSGASGFHKFYINGNTNERAHFGPSTIVFNEPGDDVDFRVESNNNANILFVDAGEDRVGIACSAPTVALDIVGDVKISDTSPNLILDDTNGTLGEALVSLLEFRATGSSQGTLGFNTSIGAMNVENKQGDLYLKADSNNAKADSKIFFEIDGGTEAVITTSGIGIACTSPNQPLIVNMPDNIKGAFFTDGTRNVRLFAGNLTAGQYNPIVEDTDNAIIYSGGSVNTGALVIAGHHSGNDSGMRFTNDGRIYVASNVGIGTSTPSYALDVVGTTQITNQGDDAVQLKFNIERAWSFLQNSTGATTQLELNSEVDGKLFKITSEDRSSVFEALAHNTDADARIHMVPNGGLVGIGTASPSSTLDIVSESNVTSIEAATTLDDIDLSRNGTFIRLLASNTSATMTADRNRIGLRVDVDNSTASADNDTSGQRIRLYGIYNSSDTSEAVYFNWAAYNLAQTTHTTGTMTSQVAGYNLADHDGTGDLGSIYGSVNEARTTSSATITNIYGSNSRASIIGGSTSTVSTAMAARAEVLIQDSTGASITNARAVYGALNFDDINLPASTVSTADAIYSYIDFEPNNSTQYVTNASLYRGVYASGSDTSISGGRWGIYLSGEDKNTIEGKLGIGTTTPTQALDVAGTITTSANVHITGAIRDSSGDYGTSGQVLSSTGAGGINWIDAGSGGGVNATGTPVDNQIAVWTAADTIEGDADLTWDGTTLKVESVTNGRSILYGYNSTSTTFVQKTGTVAAWLTKGYDATLELHSYRNTGGSTTLALLKARGGTSGPSNISFGDTIGNIYFYAYTGGSYKIVNYISSQRFTTSGGGTADLSFGDGLSEHLTIDQDGDVGIGTTDPGGVKLNVIGNIKAGPDGSGSYGHFRQDVPTYAELSVLSAQAGDRNFVSDSTTTTFNATVTTGGGSNIVPVFYDGSNWRVG